MLNDGLGKIELMLPNSCDSFTHKKGAIIHDRLKGDMFDHSYYSYSTSNKHELPHFTISFKHQPFDITNKDITFDSSICSQFLSDNHAQDFLGYLIERKCLLINKRYFTTEIIGSTQQAESEITLRAYTYIGRRILNTNIRATVKDTSQVYSQMLKILKSISF